MGATRILVLLTALVAIAGCATTTFVPRNADNTTTTIVLVRHAEKETDQGRDPALTELGEQRAGRLALILSDLQPAAIFATQYQRTQQTVAPLSVRSGIAITEVDAADIDALAQRIRDEHQGDTVVIAAHSNTLPAIISALGSEAVADIAETDYSNLYIVSLPALGTGTTIRLHF